MERLLNVREVAACLGVSSARVYAWTRKGLIPSIRVGPMTIRYSEAAIRAYLGSCTKPATVGPNAN